MIKETEEIRSRILTALCKGVDPFQILLFTVGWISHISGDNVFAEQCRKYIHDAYAVGLSDPNAVELCLQKTEEKIFRITEAVRTEENNSVRERLIFSLRQLEAEKTHLKQRNTVQKRA